MSESINKRVQKCRKLANLSQSETAERMGIKCSTYSQMERQGRISGERLLQLAEIFGVDSNYLLTGHSTSNVPVVELIKEPEVKKPTVLKQEHFSPEYPQLILTKNEENYIKILRNLSKEDHREVVELLQEKYKNSKK